MISSSWSSPCRWSFHHSAAPLWLVQSPRSLGSLLLLSPAGCEDLKNPALWLQTKSGWRWVAWGASKNLLSSRFRCSSPHWGPSICSWGSRGPARLTESCLSGSWLHTLRWFRAALCCASPRHALQTQAYSNNHPKLLLRTAYLLPVCSLFAG